MDEAYELIFSIENGAYKLQSTERLEMRVPPAGAPDAAGLEGHFVELRDAGGEALYQRPIAAPEALRARISHERSRSAAGPGRDLGALGRVRCWSPPTRRAAGRPGRGVARARRGRPWRGP